MESAVINRMKIFAFLLTIGLFGIFYIFRTLNIWGIYTCIIFIWMGIMIFSPYLQKSDVYNSPYYNSFYPDITILISVYNEENLITRTLDSILKSDYPIDKLKILVTNDGSVDSTVQVLNDYNSSRVSILDLSHQGKRKAIASSINHVDSDIVILMDSDTILIKNSISEIVKPFKDFDVGAVASNVCVANYNQNLLTMFQDTWYYSAFKHSKTAENSFGAVTCCPGPLAAYKTQYLKKVIDEFSDRKLLGKPFKYGDDRELTSLILEHHNVVYQKNALSYTEVPDNLLTFFKQQNRWKKGWFLGSLQGMKFMWKKGIFASLYFYTQIFLVLCFPLAIIYKIYDSIWISTIVGFLLVGGIFAIEQYHDKHNNTWLLRPLFGILFVPILALMLPYSLVVMLTEKQGTWGTR